MLAIELDSYGSMSVPTLFKPCVPSNLLVLSQSSCTRLDTGRLSRVTLVFMFIHLARLKSSCSKGQDFTYQFDFSVDVLLPEFPLYLLYLCYHLVV